MPLRTASPFLKTLGRPLGAFVLALLVGAAGAPLFAAEPSAADGVSAASFNLADVRSMQYQEDVLANELVIDEKAAPARPGDFVFAIEETGTNETYLRTMMPLVEALRIASPERRVLVRRIPSREFAQSVKAEKIPFVLATSGTMVSLMDELGAVPLAVRERTLTGGRAAAAAGGLLIVDAKRRELGSLASLKGARVAVDDWAAARGGAAYEAGAGALTTAALGGGGVVACGRLELAEAGVFTATAEAGKGHALTVEGTLALPRAATLVVTDDVALLPVGRHVLAACGALEGTAKEWTVQAPATPHRAYALRCEAGELALVVSNAGSVLIFR